MVLAESQLEATTKLDEFLQSGIIRKVLGTIDEWKMIRMLDQPVERVFPLSFFDLEEA